MKVDMNMGPVATSDSLLRQNFGSFDIFATIHSINFRFSSIHVT